MMVWQDVIETVGAASRRFSKPTSSLFFRGQLAESWKLVPWLGRLSRSSLDFGKDCHGNKMTYPQNLENYFYYTLRAQGGHFLPRNSGSWEILFLMQHYGFPTRLLDWSRSFGIALYFAIKRTDGQRRDLADEAAAVWILDPYRLNGESRDDKTNTLYYLDTDYPLGYEKYFAHHLGTDYGTFPHSVIAATADASNERLRVQQGAFSLHRELQSPLEKLFPSCVQKVTIPPHLFPDAQRFLDLAGIDERSLFPDISTLAAYLTRNIAR